MYLLLVLSILFASANSVVLHKVTLDGGVVFLSMALSIFLLREKLSRKQLSGILVGVLGIFIIGIL